jgi:hypothetical protein
MNNLIKKYGRKFSFALFVMEFIVLSIVLFTVLLWNNLITGIIFKELYIVASGFITLLAGSYFFANTQSKKFENKNKG